MSLRLVLYCYGQDGYILYIHYPPIYPSWLWHIGNWYFEFLLSIFVQTMYNAHNNNAQYNMLGWTYIVLNVRMFPLKTKTGNQYCTYPGIYKNLSMGFILWFRIPASNFVILRKVFCQLISHIFSNNIRATRHANEYFLSIY